MTLIIFEIKLFSQNFVRSVISKRQYYFPKSSSMWIYVSSIHPSNLFLFFFFVWDKKFSDAQSQSGDDSGSEFSTSISNSSVCFVKSFIHDMFFNKIWGCSVSLFKAGKRHSSNKSQNIFPTYFGGAHSCQTFLICRPCDKVYWNRIRCFLAQLGDSTWKKTSTGTGHLSSQI